MCGLAFQEYNPAEEADIKVIKVPERQEAKKYSRYISASLSGK